MVMYALSVKVIPREGGYGIREKSLEYRKYEGLLGVLGLSKVRLDYDRKSNEWVHFSSLDDIADHIAREAKTRGYAEIHLLPYLSIRHNSQIKRRIRQRAPQVRFANPLRRVAVPLEISLKKAYKSAKIITGYEANPDKPRVQVVKLKKKRKGIL